MYLIAVSSRQRFNFYQWPKSPIIHEEITLLYYILVLLQKGSQHIRNIILFQVSKRQNLVTDQNKLRSNTAWYVHAYSTVVLVIFILHHKYTQCCTVSGQNVGHFPCAPSQTCWASCEASKGDFSFSSSQKFIKVKNSELGARLSCSAY